LAGGFSRDRKRSEKGYKSKKGTTEMTEARLSLCPVQWGFSKLAILLAAAAAAAAAGGDPDVEGERR